MTVLAIALAAFLGTHFLMSHPLRAPLAGALGATGFQILYSLVALATFGWAIFAFRAAPATDPLWIAPNWLWTVASLIMLFGSILLAGSFFGNPALPAPGAKALAARLPRGVFAITRHPMMWGFALWALVHILVAPNQATLLLAGAVGVLALAGSAGQDVKKRKLMGEAWGEWSSRTSFVPFGNQFADRTGWATRLAGAHRIPARRRDLVARLLAPSALRPSAGRAVALDNMMAEAPRSAPRTTGNLTFRKYPRTDVCHRSM